MSHGGKGLKLNKRARQVGSASFVSLTTVKGLLKTMVLPIVG